MSEHIKMSDLTVGTVLFPDADFTCLPANVAVTVEADDDGFFVKCADGKHYLDGQEDDHGNCLGLSRDRWPQL